MSKKMKKAKSVKKSLGTVVPKAVLKYLSFTQRELQLIELGLWSKASEIQEEVHLGELDVHVADDKIKEIEALRLRITGK